MKGFKRLKLTTLNDVGNVCKVCVFKNNRPTARACEECRDHNNFIFDGYVKERSEEE